MSRRLVLLGCAAILALAVVQPAGRAAAEGWSVSKFLGGKAVEGSGKVITQERNVSPFERISSNGPLDVAVRIGSPQKVAVTIDDNLAELVSTEVRGKTLKIEITSPCRSDRNARVEITVPALAGFSNSGSGDVNLMGLEGESFEYEIAGSGDLQASGKMGSLDVSIKGSGDVDARDLDAGSVKVSIMGSGDAVVHAAESLDASIMGSGDVTCYGKPAHVEKHVMGSGEINLR
jgi:hypothetical protein